MFKLDGEESDVLLEKVDFQVADLEGISHVEGNLLVKTALLPWFPECLYTVLGVFWEVSLSNGIGCRFRSFYFTISH